MTDTIKLQRKSACWKNTPWTADPTGEWSSGVINLLHPKRLRLRVSEIRRETTSASTLRLVAREGELPPFLAGQYINLFVRAGGIRTARPYSISSSPRQNAYYDITIRRVEDGFVSNYLLDEVRVGDTLESTAPAAIFITTPCSMATIWSLLPGEAASRRS